MQTNTVLINGFGAYDFLNALPGIRVSFSCMISAPGRKVKLLLASQFPVG